MSDMYSAHASTARLAQGTRLNGIFEIEKHIASGGMGEIYRGHAIETGDVVAIKVMRTDLADNTMALALFRKEASALHYIHHDAIVRYYIFSLDPGTGRHYLAMEFVDGQPLSDLLKHGPLSFEAMQHLQERLAGGLDAAHQHGIIHRDLSPDNVLIPSGDVGRAKIIDFGIARSTKSNDGTIIGSGFAGKFNYVSPEQLGLYGGDVSAKSDIYSLGLVLAECLSGRPIDMGGSQFEVLEKRRAVPDLGAIDARFRPLIEQMLQSDPKDRPESMATVAAWRPSASSVARAPRTPVEAPRRNGTSARRLALGALAAVLLLCLGGIFYYFFQDSAAVPPENMTARPPVLNPDTGVDARRAEDARRTAAENLARQRADEAKRVAEANAKSEPGRLSTNDRPPSDPKERIRQFVNAYDGGDCFFVAPVAVAEGNATIEGYGRSATPFEVLDYEFKRANGFEASVGYHAVTPPQCAAISFLARLRNQRGPAPRLDVSAGNLRSNGYVSGFIADFGNRNVELLMVDHEGIVLSLTSLLKGDGDPKSFTISLKREDAGAPKLQILLALVTSKPLESLRPAQPGSMEVGSADQVFARAFDEAQKAGQSINVSAKSFSLEK
jgi:tRNA A-37 threonylcarbamoyl transferase component Bud32